MTPPANPYELMQQAAQQVREARKEHREQVQVCAKAKQAFYRDRAVAYLKAEGTVDERKAHAEIAASDARFNYDIAEGLLVSALEAIRSFRQELELWRSVASAAKEGVASEWIMAGEEPAA